MHRLRPLSLREANTYVTAHHRHSKRVLCHKFSIGLEADGDLVGVAIVALPIARGLADGLTAEVRRVCTLGHPNACSTLYSAARKTALAMGFTRIVTYIREDELGTSLKAAGWHPVQVDRRRNHWDDHPRPASAQERVQRYIELASQQGQIAVGAAPVPADGWFCPPTLVSELPPDSPVLGEEVFGPLLAVERVRDVEHACDRVDGLPFALTGGLFARDPATVRYVRDRTPVGNLYVNSSITGAMVGRQPFGGNRLSGTGTQAGGPDYLLNFVEPRAVSENIMRHGLEV